MAKVENFSRIILKRTNIPTQSATTAPSTDHTILPAWSSTDIYVGEFYANTSDEKLWLRFDSNIRRVLFEDDIYSGPITLSGDTDYQIIIWSGNTWSVSNKLIEPGTFIFTPETGIMEYETPEAGKWEIAIFGSSTGITGVVEGDFLVFDGEYWVNSGVSLQNNNLSITNISDAYTGLTTDQYIRCSGSTYTVKLPVTTGSGRLIYIKNLASGSVTLTGSGSDVIDGGIDFSFSTYNESIRIIDAATGYWEIVSHYYYMAP